MFIHIYQVLYSNYEAQTEASIEMHGVDVDRGGLLRLISHTSIIICGDDNFLRCDDDE